MPCVLSPSGKVVRFDTGDASSYELYEFLVDKTLVGRFILTYGNIVEVTMARAPVLEAAALQHGDRCFLSEAWDTELRRHEARVFPYLVARDPGAAHTREHNTMKKGLKAALHGPPPPKAPGDRPLRRAGPRRPRYVAPGRREHPAGEDVSRRECWFTPDNS